MTKQLKKKRPLLSKKKGSPFCLLFNLMMTFEEKKIN